MTASFKAPLVWSKASIIDVIPTSRLSCSMLSAATSRVKSIDAGSYGFVYRSRGLPHMGESLPTNDSARDDFPSVPSAADLSATTMTPGDPSSMSPSIRPTPGTVAWAVDGAGHTGASGATTVVLDRDPSVTTAATSTYVGRVTTGCVAPTTVGAMSTVGSLVHPVIGSGIAAMASCSTTSEGAL